MLNVKGAAVVLDILSGTRRTACPISFERPR